MSRLTMFDAVRGCYVIDPDATGNHIQKLGQLEDRDEEAQALYDADKIPSCAICKATLEEGANFCKICGQRLKWGD